MAGSIQGPTYPYLPEGIPLSTLEAQINQAILDTGAIYNSATSNYDTAKQAYDDKLAELNSLWAGFDTPPTEAQKLQYKAAIDEAEVLKNQLQSATDALVSAATDCVSVYAQRQLLKDAQANTAIGPLISELAPFVGVGGSFFPFPGLSSAQYAEEQQSFDPDHVAARDALTTAFNSYRKNEWDIAQARREKKALEMSYEIARRRADVDPSYETERDTLWSQLQAKIAELEGPNGFIEKRTQYKTSLDNAFATYSSFFGSNDPLLAALQRVASYSSSATWSGTLAAMIETASADTEAAYAAAGEAADQAEAAHYEQATGQISEYQEQALEVGEAHETLMESLLGSKRVASTMPSSELALPIPGLHGISIWQLVELLSKVQMYLQKIDQMTAQADASVAALQFQIFLLHLSLLSKQQELYTKWAELLRDADLDFNKQVSSNNSQSFEKAANIYNQYANNISTINNVIDDANTEIDSFNARAAGLHAVAESISPQIMSAVDAAATSVTLPPTTTTPPPERQVSYLDFLQIDPEIQKPTVTEPIVSTPTPIPHLSHLSGLNFQPIDLTNYQSPSLETYVPSSQDFADLQSKVEELLTAIGPIEQQVISALANEVPAGQNLTLEKPYEASNIEVRDLTAVNTYADVPSALFSMLLLFMIKRAIAESEETTPSPYIDFFSQFSSLFEGEGANMLIAPGVLSALELISLKSSPSDLAELLSDLLRSESFSDSIEKILEKAALLAGVYATSLNQPQKAMTGFGLTAAIFSGEAKTQQQIDDETSKDVLDAFTLFLLTNAANAKALRSAAMSMLRQYKPLTGLPQETVEQMIAMITRTQQFVLVFVATMAGSDTGNIMGMSSAVAEPAIGPIGTLIGGLERIGIPLPKATELAEVLGPQGSQIQSLFSRLGYSPTQSTMLTALLASSVGKVSLRSNVPGGSAYLEALRKDLEKSGIVVNERINSETYPQALINAAATASDAWQADEKRSAEIRKENEATKVKLISVLGTLIESRKGVSSAPSKPVSERLMEAVAAFREEFKTPLVAAEAVDFTPREVLDQLVTAFAGIPAEIQTSLKSIAPTMPGMRPDESAALVLGIKQGYISSDDAAYLSFLAEMGAEKSFSEVQNTIVTRLFRTPPEEIQRRREERAAEVLKDERDRTEGRRLLTPRPNLAEGIKRAYATLLKSSPDEQAIMRAVESFARVLPNIGDFNKISLKVLTEPGKEIAKNFSIITRAVRNMNLQPPIIP